MVGRGQFLSEWKILLGGNSLKSFNREPTPAMAVRTGRLDDSGHAGSKAVSTNVESFKPR